MYVLAQTIIMNTFGTAGFIANFIVIVVLVKFTSLRKKPSTKFILMQSVIDALTSLLLVFSDRNLGGNLKLVKMTYSDNIFGK